jgi:3-phytase
MAKIYPLLLALFLLGCGRSTVGGSFVRPLGAFGQTEEVSHDPDDPAIWIHPDDPSLSLIVGTNKVELPNGALYVYDLDGKTLQRIGGLNRPNNVDIEQGVRIGGEVFDIAVVTERVAKALRIYSIDSQNRRLSEMAKLSVFEGEDGEFSDPMGIALYKRPDGATFAIVGRKSGPLDGYLWQYRLESGPSLRLVRKFGRYSGNGEIEAIAIDDALGYVYYADEGAGIRKYYADPEHADASQELAFFGRTGYTGDREGLAIYPLENGSGYIVSTDQIDGKSRYFLYRREGSSGKPHDHSEVVMVLDGSADSTDGIEVSALPLRPALPHGLLIAMNSARRNFLLFKWP